MKKGLLPFLILSIFSSVSIHANDLEIKRALDRLGIKNATMQPLSIKGLKSVLTDQGMLYLTEDGKYILNGQLYDIRGKNPVNLTNQLLLTKLEALQDQMIIYKAPKEKYVINVFTDSTCSYCQKLHHQIHEYNNVGITVRYLAYPRQGLGSKVEKEMQSIWCNSDKIKALDSAMKGHAISLSTCKNDIKKHYVLGAQFGVQGTPSIILNNGMMIQGYYEAKEMISILETNQVSKKIGS